MDSPLADIRRQLALTVGDNAVFDGWSDKAVASVPLCARATPNAPAAIRSSYTTAQRSCGRCS